MRLTRTDRSLIAEWWFSVDRLLIGAVLLIMFLGVIVSLAASPAVAHKIGEEPLYFFKRHLIFLIPSVILLIGASMLDPKLTRRAGRSCSSAVSRDAAGDVQGHREERRVRWLIIGGRQSIQPSNTSSRLRRLPPAVRRGGQAAICRFAARRPGVAAPPWRSCCSPISPDLPAGAGLGRIVFSPAMRSLDRARLMAVSGAFVAAYFNLAMCIAGGPLPLALGRRHASDDTA